MEAEAASEPQALEALARLGAPHGLFHVSYTGRSPPQANGVTKFQAGLALHCPRPPTGQGICAVAGE